MWSYPTVRLNAGLDPDLFPKAAGGVCLSESSIVPHLCLHNVWTLSAPHSQALSATCKQWKSSRDICVGFFFLPSGNCPQRSVTAARLLQSNQPLVLISSHNYKYGDFTLGKSVWYYLDIIKCAKLARKPELSFESWILLITQTGVIRPPCNPTQEAGGGGVGGLFFFFLWTGDKPNKSIVLLQIFRTNPTFLSPFSPKPDNKDNNTLCLLGGVIAAGNGSVGHLQMHASVFADTHG